MTPINSSPCGMCWITPINSSPCGMCWITPINIGPCTQWWKTQVNISPCGMWWMTPVNIGHCGIWWMAPCSKHWSLLHVMDDSSKHWSLWYMMNDSGEAIKGSHSLELDAVTSVCMLTNTQLMEAHCMSVWSNDGVPRCVADTTTISTLESLCCTATLLCPMRWVVLIPAFFPVISYVALMTTPVMG